MMTWMILLLWIMHQYHIGPVLIDLEFCTFQFQLSVTCIQWEPCFSFHGVNLLDSSPRRPGPRNFITLSTRVWSKIIIKDLLLTNSYRYLLVFFFFFWKNLGVFWGKSTSWFVNPKSVSKTLYNWIEVIVDYGSVFVTYGKITEMKLSWKESSFLPEVPLVKLIQVEMLIICGYFLAWVYTGCKVTWKKNKDRVKGFYWQNEKEERLVFYWWVCFIVVVHKTPWPNHTFTLRSLWL